VKMPYVLFVAIAFAAGIGGARGLAAATADRAPDAGRPAAGQAEPPAAAFAAESSAPGSIDGQVLEVVQVPRYTYLRLGEKGAEGTWVAVPTASVEPGSRARVRDAMRMTDFTSTALGRTFPVIYFGTLEGGRPALDKNPHAWGQDPHGSAEGLPAAGAITAPHAPLGPVAVEPVARAPGPTGRTVAELVAQRTELAGKTVRVHATVVKVTPGVLGHTYLHLRDGSGDAVAGTHDVAATTDATLAIGDTVVLEGVVAIDRDIGSGYKFPILIENARILGTP
jgi:hypothetical protein